MSDDNAKYEHEERRKNYIIDPAFAARLHQHITLEEERERVETERRATLEGSIQANTARVAAIEKEMGVIAGIISAVNGFAKSMRIVASLLSFIMVIFGWIVIEKINDIKAIQSTLNDHSLQIAKTLVILENVVATQHSDVAKLEQHLETERAIYRDKINRLGAADKK